LQLDLSSPPNEKRLTRREASSFLTDRGYPVALATLEKYAVYGGGPSFRYFGRRPLYAPTDLLTWVAERSSGPRRSTSDAPLAA
jgi:hypothetical protein